MLKQAKYNNLELLKQNKQLISSGVSLSNNLAASIQNAASSSITVNEIVMESDNIHLQPNISTDNRFDCLSLSADNPTDDIIKLNNNKKNKQKNYVPPIVVQGLNYTKIKQLLLSLNITNYLIKIISIGIKIMLYDNENYHNLLDKLKANNTEHFTFRSVIDRPLKVCITGLPSDFIHDDIITGLQQNNIEKDNIISIHSIYKKLPDTTTVFKYFLIKFKNNQVKMQMLHKIKHIHHTAVRFSHYSNNSSLPTQCRRCQMFGHGSSHCNKTIKCGKCSANHLTSECNLDPASYKCANCGAAHPTSSKDCAKLKEFQIIKQNIHINRQIRNLQSRRVQHPNLSNVKEFPGLPEPKSSPLQSTWNSIFNTAGSSRNRAESNYGIGRQAQVNKLNNNINFANNINNNNTHNNTNNSNLFTESELQSLISDILCNLSKCSNKSEQFEVCFRLSIKYLHNFK